MIELHFYPSPNGLKIAMMLEECGLPYRIVEVDILRGAQFAPEFLRISPNNRIPAIVDTAAEGGPLSVFESGAILQYLAEKSGQLLPADPRGRYEVLQWLYWQVGGLGPMAGQAHHFRAFAAEVVPYGIKRYTDEVNRLYGVMDRRLADRPYLAGEYSIADIACWPWIVPHERQGQSLADFPHVRRWFEAIRERPAVRRAYEKGHERMADAEAYKFLYGQTAQSVENRSRERLTMTDLILHSYDASPFTQRALKLLAIKGLEWRSVTTPMMPPKDDLLALTGGYRGTPVLQIGADVYIDSQRIAAELEARFPQPTYVSRRQCGARTRRRQMGRRVLSRRPALRDRRDQQCMAARIPARSPGLVSRHRFCRVRRRACPHAVACECRVRRGAAGGRA